MRSSEVATEAGANVQTLRYYERPGLLADPPRTGSGYRLYPPETVDTVRFVKRAPELGFPLGEEQELLHLAEGGPADGDTARDLARARIGLLQRKIEDLNWDAGFAGRAGDHVRTTAGRPELPVAARSAPRSKGTLMRLQILQVPDCPNVTLLRERLDAALADTAAEVTVRVIDDDAEAAAAGMAGSPTLLVDGADPFAEPRRPPSMSCRLYRDTDGRITGAPSVAQLRQALFSQVTSAATDGIDSQESQCCASGSNVTEPSATTLQAWRARATPPDPAEHALHQVILWGFAVQGVVPDSLALEQAAAPCGWPVAEVLARLHDRDVVRLGADGAIRAAYPFSAVPTRHQVQLAHGPRVDAMCVIDALGIPAMLDTDAVITTAAPDSGLPITITVTSGRAVWEPPTAVVFVGAQAGAGLSAELCCDHLNAFPDRAAGQAWVTAHPEVPGSIVNGAEVEQLGARIFGGLLRG